jgi:fibro-slime domain-containing protein
MRRSSGLLLALTLACGCAADDGVESTSESARDAGLDRARDGDAGRVLPPPGNDEPSGSAKPRTPSSDGASDDDESRCGALIAQLRDFSLMHPDFEDVVNGSVVKGIVEAELDERGKPVENRSVAAGASIHAFADWYQDGPQNMQFELELKLAAAADGKFVFDSTSFFPLDGKGYGNEYRDHNFGFTTEVHTSFVYKGGEQFTFAGDDDVWVFIDGRLAIDLGGVHARSTATVALDTLGLDVGGRYPMDIFHAERHSGDSNFRIETTIDCIEPVVIF